MLKKIIVLLLAAMLILSSVAFSFAQEPEDALRELGVPHPGILPSNPFYFTKEWKRSIRQLFTFRAVKKVENELQVVNERLAELITLFDQGLENERRIVEILQEYREHIRTLSVHIAALDGADVAHRITLDTALATGIAHSHIVRSILWNYENASDDVRAEILQEVDAVPLAAVRTMGDSAYAAAQAAKSADTAYAPALRYLVLLQLLNDAEAQSDDAVSAFSSAKDAVALQFEGAFRAGDITEDDVRDALRAITDRTPEILQTIDELRERLIDSDVKTTIGLLQRSVYSTPNNITIEIAEASLAVAQKAAERLQDSIAHVRAGDFPYANALLEKALFNVERAQESLGLGNYGVAFEQGSAARAAAETGAGILSQATGAVESGIQALKENYDAVNERVRNAASEAIASGIRDAVSTIEGEIVSLSQSSATQLKERVVLLIREAAVRLEIIRAHLNE